MSHYPEADHNIDKTQQGFSVLGGGNLDNNMLSVSDIPPTISSGSPGSSASLVLSKLGSSERVAQPVSQSAVRLSISPNKTPSKDGERSPNKPIRSSISPNKTPSKDGERSPNKPRALAPKSLFTKKAEYIPLPKIKKKGTHYSELKNAVRPILPKTFILGPKASSPTKTTALMLKRKATLVCQRRSPVKILPKRPNLESVPPPTFSRVFTRSQGSKGKVDASFQDTSLTNNTIDHTAPAVKKVPGNSADAIEIDEPEDSVTSQEEDANEVEKDEDQMQLDDLMAACTTIRYDPKKVSSVQDTDNKSKSQKRRDICLAMLEEDILESDPRKDERDTEYARDYFNRVKEALKGDPYSFRQFLTILHDMNKDNSDPVKLYAEVSSLLHDHQDLVDDFAGFLLPFQAVECGCFVSYLQYQQLREFLRKLEIYCENTTTPFHRTLKMLSRWLAPNQESQLDGTTFKDKIAVLLKNVPGVLEELLDYFLDGPLPDSQADEFEEVTLGDSNRAGVFEEVTLPGGRETYNTRLCGCDCHQDKADERLQKRTKHCFSCSLKLENGIPVMKMSRHEYTPLTVIYPHEEKEKLRKAKQEAAQLALAKAKAQRSGRKTGKAKGSTSQNSKSKRLVLKRQQRKRISKSEGGRPKSASCCEQEPLELNPGLSEGHRSRTFISQPVGSPMSFEQTKVQNSTPSTDVTHVSFETDTWVDHNSPSNSSENTNVSSGNSYTDDAIPAKPLIQTIPFSKADQESHHS